MAIVTKIFNYEGGVRLAEIPAGTTQLTLHIWGGAGGGGGNDAGGNGGTGSAGHYVTKTDVDMTAYAGVKNIAVAVGGGGAGGTSGSGAEGGRNGKSLTGYSGGTGGPSGSSGVSGSGAGGGGATVISIYADGESVTNTVLAIAGGGAGGGGAGRLSTGGVGANSNNPTAESPSTLGENGAGHDYDGGGAGAGGGGAAGGTGGSGDQGDIGAFGGRAGSNTVPASGSSDDGSGVTPGGTASGYYTTGVAQGGAAQTSGGNGKAVLIFNIPSLSNYKVGGTWKKLNEIYHKVSGTWKNVTAGYYKVAGEWKAIFASDVLFSINYAIFGDATGNPTSGTPGTQGVPTVTPATIGGGGDNDARIVEPRIGRQEWGGIDGVEAVWSGTTQSNTDKGSGSNPRVICTYFYHRGMFDLTDLQCDYEWSRQNLSENVKIGYWLWAVPLVKWMEKNENSTTMWSRFWIWWTLLCAQERGREISYKMGVRNEGSLFGKVARTLGESFCYVLGSIAKPFVKDRYKLLLKDY